MRRARDRHQLLDRDRIGSKRPLDVDVDVEPLQPLAGAAAGGAPRDQPELVWLAAERQAMNAGIQGLAADIFKLALVRLDRDLEAAGVRRGGLPGPGRRAGDADGGVGGQAGRAPSMS